MAPLDATGGDAETARMSGVFEHLITLGSFILALGLATILMFVATLVHRRHEVKLSMPHMLWMAAIFVNQINFWLGSYAFHDIARADLADIIFVVVFPILLYLQSALVVTEQAGALDLRAHHARNKRAYVGMVIAATVFDAINFLRAMVTNPDFDPTIFLVADAVLISTALAAILVDKRWVQIAAPGIHLVVRVFGFALVARPLMEG